MQPSAALPYLADTHCLTAGLTAVLVSPPLPLKQNYGVRATGQQCTEAGAVCAICQAEFRDPMILLCQVS